MQQPQSAGPRMAFVGFGEAGQAFCGGLQPQAARAYDRAPLADRYAAAGVAGGSDPAAALEGAGLVFCLVTADQALAAAETCAPHLTPAALWLDGNSCAPATKRRAAAVIAAAGGRYVDMAIMAPVHPLRHRTPVLLAGPDACAAAAVLDTLGMAASVVAGPVGAASAIKMIRSVMVKGVEALTAECFLAARRAGVDAAVIGSLAASDPGIDWPAQGAYNLERMMVHGARRAAEMAEVAATLRELGLPDRMARATMDWQAQIAALGLAAGPAVLDERADRILRALV